MSGLTQNNNQGVTFLKATQGKFFLSSDKDNENPYDELTGRITRMDFRDESFNGANIRKLYINVQSNAGTFRFGVKVEGSAYQMLVGFLKNADLSKELTISPLAEPINEKIVATKFLVNQGGSWLKSGYPKKGEPGALPAWKPVEINGKTFWDKKDFLDAIEADVNQLTASLSGVPVSTPPSTPTSPTPKVEEPGEDDSELPF